MAVEGGKKFHRRTRRRISRRCFSNITELALSQSLILVLLVVMAPSMVANTSISSLSQHTSASISTENVALLAGTSGGFRVCGIDRKQSSWFLELDARRHSVVRTLFNGAEVVSKNVEVHDTPDGCVYYGFRNVSRDLAGLYRFSDNHSELEFGAFLQVVTAIVPQTTHSRVDAGDAASFLPLPGKHPAAGRLHFRHSGLMRLFPHMVDKMSCNCVLFRHRKLSVIDCSKIDSVLGYDSLASCSIEFRVPVANYMRASNSRARLSLSNFIVQSTVGLSSQIPEATDHSRTYIVLIACILGLLLLVTASVFLLSRMARNVPALGHLQQVDKINSEKKKFVGETDVVKGLVDADCARMTGGARKTQPRFFLPKSSNSFDLFRYNGLSLIHNCDSDARALRFSSQHNRIWERFHKLYSVHS
jgi:hypothetical protein